MKVVRSALYETARALGLLTVFGNPGSTEETMLTDFPADFRYVLAMHKGSAIAMADGFAQRQGRAALVKLHTADGRGNALGNIETAFYNRAPLVIIAGQQTREMLVHDPYLVNPDPTSIAAPFVKWAYETKRAEDVPAALVRAHAMAIQAPPGPVFMSIPMDDFEKPFTGDLPARVVEGRLDADPALSGPVAQALIEAEKPALGFWGAIDQDNGWNNAVRLAERLGALTWAPPSEGRPDFPGIHPLYQGVLPAAIQPLSDALKGHDLVVVIGAPVFRYNPFVPGPVLPSGARLIQITDNSTDAAAAWAGDSILAGPARTCALLVDAIPPRGSATASARAPEPEPRRTSPLSPDALYAAIQQARPAHSILDQESHSTLQDLRKRLPTAHPASFFSMASGVLGYGLPAAVGMALGERDLGGGRKVVAVIGDGASQHRADVLFVIVANRAYDILRVVREAARHTGRPWAGRTGSRLPQSCARLRRVRGAGRRTRRGRRCPGPPHGRTQPLPARDARRSRRAAAPLSVRLPKPRPHLPRRTDYGD